MKWLKDWSLHYWYWKLHHSNNCNSTNENNNLKGLSSNTHFSIILMIPAKWDQNVAPHTLGVTKEKKRQSRGCLVWYLLANILILKQVVDVAFVFFPLTRKDTAIEHLSFNTQRWLGRFSGTSKSGTSAEQRLCTASSHHTENSTPLETLPRELFLRLCEQH